MEHKSILIKDTTKEERIQIIEESFSSSDFDTSCGGSESLSIDYQQYIDGKKELKDLNAGYQVNYIQSGLTFENDPHSCPL